MDKKALTLTPQKYIKEVIRKCYLVSEEQEVSLLLSMVKLSGYSLVVEGRKVVESG